MVQTRLEQERLLKNIDERFNNQSIDMNNLNDKPFIVGWYPEQYCKLEHLGNWEFKVLESVKMKVRVGENFYASNFYVGETNPNNIFPTIIAEGFDYGSEEDNISDRKLC